MNNKCVAAVLLCVALGGAASAPAQERRQIPEFRTYGRPASTEDERAVDALIRNFEEAWGRQDTSALVALHAEDVEWTNAYARIIQGAEPLGRFLEQRLFPGFDPAVSRQEAANMKIISKRFIGSDAAVVHLYTDGQRGASRNANEETRRTHMHLVLERKEAGWRIVHTAIMDAR
ncbi:YybH family protein [Peristeroidobacter agariperforans]|uniref:YybH family protein n=1 Tax=Peristeroidobacter agariperforans TaxID=268404 RepID=UPI0018E51205|nr:SgcJ/EcaC family oxidoreductase [Peristeroidobacter agariperforans]